MEYIEIFNNIITVISFILNILLIFPLLKKIYEYVTKKIFVKKLLSFNSEAVQIFHSTFDLTTTTGSKNIFITYSSLESINNIIYLLNIINQKFDLISNRTDCRNEINIGGFMTNKKVNAYFSKHFSNFKYVTSITYKSAYDNYGIDKRIIEYSSDKLGFRIDDDLFLETNRKISDYAFLIKLVKSDFKDDTPRTVHILFGGGDLGTVKATEYLLTHYKQIYQKYKNNHYFFALNINRIDESIDYSTGIIDLTDRMFK